MNTRRSFLKNVGSMAFLSSLPFTPGKAGNPSRVVILGGGVAGTHTAASLKLLAPSLQVQLVDASLTRNNVRTLKREELARLGANTVVARAHQLDPINRKVILSSGESVEGDVLVVAPGVEFNWAALPEIESRGDVFHAWQSAKNEQELQTRLSKIVNGETMVMTVPKAPYVFPQGLYQRATRIALYLEQHKPDSKLIVLDTNPSTDMMQNYQAVWHKHLSPGRVEWVSAASIEVIDMQNQRVTAGGVSINAGLLNIIPPQQAGNIARNAGLCAQGDWCDVHADTLASREFEHVYVVGDANNAANDAKTAVTAMQQSVRCAQHIATQII